MRKPAERFPAPRNIHAHLEYEGDPREVSVRLTDFSITGAGFEMSEEPRDGASITIVMANGTQRFELSAVIKWAALREEGLWRAGCQFSKGIGAPRMFGTDPNRAACELPVRVSSEDGSVEGAEATVVDHSTGGIGLWADFAPKPKTRLHVSGVDTADCCTVTVQWCSTERSGSFIGCQFEDSSDRAVFQTLLTQKRCQEPFSVHRQ